MSEDREIVRAIWEGKVPVKFVLSEAEIISFDKPQPFYIMMNRIFYISQISDKIQRHFIEYINKKDFDEVWFEYNGCKLKWHYPIGLLYDLLASEDALPWVITVHLTNFPKSELLRNSASLDSLQSYFIMCVKEADALRHRSQVMSNLQKSDYNKLWFGFKDSNFDQFWSVNRRLIERIYDEPFKYIPFRIYDSELNYKTKLVSPVCYDTGEVSTLGTLLKQVLPESTYSKWSKKQLSTIIHGMEVRPEIPLQWLSENLSYPDNFLHIALVYPKSSFE
ncbi:autophagy protein 5-like [Symsagittifera roscoffensis]|uniref:autophagy protein 5-like n=1 Tax=Symsagittifera roscoffensis TaxID=84072 RepID=UPI00307BC6F8